MLIVEAQAPFYSVLDGGTVHYRFTSVYVCPFTSRRRVCVHKYVPGGGSVFCSVHMPEARTLLSRLKEDGYMIVGELPPESPEDFPPAEPSKPPPPVSFTTRVWRAFRNATLNLRNMV